MPERHIDCGTRQLEEYLLWSGRSTSLGVRSQRENKQEHSVKNNGRAKQFDRIR